MTKELQAITGLYQLRFESSGALTLGEEAPKAGSKSARQLLSAANSGQNVVVVEDASGRSDVVFCRVVAGRWSSDEPTLPKAYVVLMDFTDFDRILGDKAARNAFNVAWGFLHELDHVVNNSTDPEVLGVAGECEESLNAMRREISLPVRLDYFFTLFPVMGDSTFSRRLVRLAFEGGDGVSSKKRRFWLIWDASAVGGLAQTAQIASIQAATN